MSYTHDIRPGDTIRRIANPIDRTRAIGDVSLAGKYKGAPMSQMSVVYTDNTGRETYSMASDFEVIARAGDPVTFQPGDVVEVNYCEASPVAHKMWSGRGVVEALLIPTGWFKVHVNGMSGGFSATDLRLVHRPDALAAVEPTLTTAQIADTLRPGDKVRFIVEGVVGSPTDRVPSDAWLVRQDEIQSIEILSRAAPCPPAGKLTSTDDLLPGDILVCTTPGLGLFGEQVTVRSVDSYLIRTSEGLYHPSHFAFVRRPVAA